MLDISSSDGNKPMEQPNNDLSKAIGQLSVSTDNSDKTSTPPKNLSDMPVDVVGLIIERSEYKQQLKLRKVSKSLRALVDNQKPACKSIEVEYYSRAINITFNNHIVVYSNSKYDDDFKKAAFVDLTATLQNPKLQLEEFSFSFITPWENDIKIYYNEIQKVLESLNHKLSVKKVELVVLSPSYLLEILSFLKPGFLEKISLYFDCGINWIIDSTGMDQIALLEQWKQAEELELQYCIDRFPMEYATHFKRFHIILALDSDKLAIIKNFLSQLDNFEHCTLSHSTFSSDPNFVYELLGEPVFRSFMEEIFHHSIPNSDYYLELKKAEGSESDLFEKIEIEKKKRENG